MPGRKQVYVKRGFGRRGLVGEVVLTVRVQVAAGKHGESRARDQGGGLLLRGQPGQVLREVQVAPADNGIHQQALAGLGYQLLGAGGGVKLLVAPVPDSVSHAVGTLALVESLLDALAQPRLVDVAQQELGFDQSAQLLQGPVERVLAGVGFELAEQAGSLAVAQLQGDDQAQYLVPVPGNPFGVEARVGQQGLPQLAVGSHRFLAVELLVGELADVRLGRSLREVLDLIEELIPQKRCRLTLVKQGLDLDPQNYRDMTHKILLTIFSMLAELERGSVSERTKEELRSRREQDIVLGKPRGVVQPSMYDADHGRIQHLHALGVPLATIVDVHLKYGRYFSLKNHLAKLQRQPARDASA